MHISDDDTPLLKRWIVKRLEDISDADSDVLADYVLALVKSEDPDEQVKETCRESLEDFLRDQTRTFVDDVFDTIRSRSYVPGYVPPQPTTSTLIPTAPAFNPPTGPAAFQNRAGPAATQQNGNVNGTGEQSRKRRFREGSESREDTHYSQRGTGDRLTKQMRRGGSRGGTLSAGIGRAGPLPAQSQIALPGMSSPPGAPGFPAGLPPFDPSNPLAAVLAMQAAMGFLPFPGMSGSPTGFQQGAGNSLPPRKPGQRCRDYDTKGFCALGTACPYDHGQDHLVAPGQTEEYDPTNAKVDSFRSSNHSGYGDRNRGDRGRGRGRGSFGGKGRAAFSHAGPSFDKTNMKIVVEQIPEDKFSEQHIREFFSEFGEIEEVQLQPYKHLAIVKYNDHESAKRAYDSPKVIFDNRFVKVYWYKQDGLPNPNTARAPRDRSSSHNANQKPDEEMIDPEEFQRKQAEAQKAQDEKKKKLEEAEVQRKELERKMKEAAEARKKLLEKLAAKSAGSNGTPSSDPASKGGETDGSGATTASQTDTLKAKLAELEAEAASLGLPAEEQFQSGFRGRGRGGYRGRGGFPPRGRGFDPSRGSWRGRGAFSGAHRGGVMRLDNRPKKIAVTAPNLASGKDEAFRQYLFNNFEFEGIEPHPDQTDTQIVSFKERYVAEMFMNKSSDIPSVGPVEMDWYASPAGIPSTTGSTASGQAVSAKQDLGLIDAVNGNDPSAVRAEGGEMDYDVADEEDRWMG